MPYSIPAPAPAPLPIHSQGRPGHRRSFSEIAYSTTTINGMPASTFSSNTPSAPRERQTSGAFAPLASLPRRKPASFHLEADDDDDSSQEDEPGPSGPNRPQPTPHPSQQQRRISPNSSSSQINLRPTPPGRPINLPSEDEDDEYARGLPPLKLKIPSSNPALNIPFSPSPTGTTTMQPNTLPFPRTISPPRSRTASMDAISGGGVQFQVKSPTPTTATATGTRSGNTTPTRTESPRPFFPRTASTPVLLSNASSTGGPIILSNGKPLKSSLKSSSSSPNIPFPSQSLVPSRIYAEIAKKQQEERERLANSAGNSPVQESGTYPDFTSEFGANRHMRAASAPALPSLTLTSEPESPLDTCPPTPSAPKAVHFPSSDDGALATIKFFKRSARPASLSVPGASGGEETETETDGEGYNSGPGGGYNGYNANTSWGQWGGGYTNPWDRYTAAKSSSSSPSSVPQSGLNAPRIAASSPLGPQGGKLPQRQPAQRKKMTMEEKRLVYEVDRASSSDVPRKDLGLFDNVFLEDMRLDAPSTLSSSSSTSDQSQDERKVTSLKGSLLVRNLAYEKHVSVRFTLDGWHTTSEVKAEYQESLEKLPGWIVGVLRGDRTMLKDDGTKPPSIDAAPPKNPQWDRFTFSIDLSDYARSRSLANRTLWMVVRFGVPGTVRVPLGVPLLSRDFTPIHSSSSSTPLAAPQLDVMSPSSPDLLSTLISGIAGSPNPSPASQAAYAKGREIVEEVLRRVRCCVGVGVGNEWWDNNGGGNFRVGFKEREVVDVKEEDVPVEASSTQVDGSTTPSTAEATQSKEGGAAGQGPAAATRPRRANAVSCPPMFSGNAPAPPPMSILDKSLSHSSLSPPQISSSTSLDSASSSSSAPPTPSAFSLLPSSSSSLTSPSYGGPSNQSGTPSPWPQRTPAANKAMAETTLERLKRLNLRNYAAPSVNSTGRVMAAPVPPPAILTTPLTTTATTVRSPPAHPSSTTTSSTAAAEIKVKDFGSANGKVDDTLSVPKGHDGLSAEGPPSRTSSVSSTSSWTSTASLDSRSGSGSGSGGSGSETTPMTSPLCTPTSMRSSVWDGATPTKEDVNGAVVAEETKEVVGEEQEEEVGVELEPSLGRVTPRPIAVKSNANDTSTILKKDGDIGVSPNAMLTSPLLGAFMAGPGSAAISGEGYDPLDAGLMGTSPPFSMFGGGAGAGGRSAGGTARSVVFGWGEPASSKDGDSSSVSSSGEDSAQTPTPSTIPLITTKPSHLILDSIREKNVSSPVRSPVGSGRSSPVTGVLVPSVSSSSNLSAHFNPINTSSKESRAPTRPTLVAATSNYTNLKEARTGSGSDSGSGSPSNSKNSGSGSGGSVSGSKGHHTRRHGHHRGGSSSSSTKTGLLSPLPLNMTSSPLQSPTSISPSNSFSGAPPTGNVGSRSNSLDDIRDPDSIYQAFVRQWCFASGPAPPQAAGFGAMNNSSKETGERKKHAM